MEKEVNDKKNKADPRNKLNNLNNTDWMIATKSVWKGYDKLDKSTRKQLADLREAIAAQLGIDSSSEFLGQPLPSVSYSTPPPRDNLKEQHPATYAESDIEKLIRFFTKEGEKVLDPFLGTGSTLIACLNAGRNGVGIELMPKWADTAVARIQKAKDSIHAQDMQGFDGKGETRKAPSLVIQGDSKKELLRFKDEEFQFIVTSPPYWNILHKNKDHKIKRERLARGLDTRYGDEKADLGNIRDYREFLAALGGIYKECQRILARGRYMCVVVNDFRHESRFISYHSDLSKEISSYGFTLEGITILVQDNKNLYPYGVPFAFISNIHHQYILVFRKSPKP